MRRLLGFARQAVIDDRGQDLIEYALLGALIAIACIVSMQGVATQIVTIFSTVSSSL